MSLSSLSAQPEDPLLHIIAQYSADSRPDKIDLGVGAFRDPHGRTPVMAAVREAELRLWKTQETKAYVGPAGDRHFVSLLGEEALGDASLLARGCGVQTPGGTGALRLAAEVLTAAGVKRLWAASPTWANHPPVFAAAGIECRLVRAFDLAEGRYEAEHFLSALNDAEPGDAVLLHGCGHNPTGLDPDAAQWAVLAGLLAERGLVPLVDMAYQGLGDGFAEDAAGALSVLRRAPYALLAYSCDKNFGLYRERTGALWAFAPDASGTRILESNMLAKARVNWSMPPDHGAAVVRLILEDPVLKRCWREELDGMRQRLTGLRAALARGGRIGSVDCSVLDRGRGLFATLPMSPDDIRRLREDHAIYMAGSGRLNIAGFTDKRSVATFLSALREVLA